VGADVGTAIGAVVGTREGTVGAEVGNVVGIKVGLLVGAAAKETLLKEKKHCYRKKKDERKHPWPFFGVSVLFL